MRNNRKDVNAMDKDRLRQQILQRIDAEADQLKRIALDLHQNPELGGEERFAANRLTGYASEQGFQVTRPLEGLETAFRATAGQTGPKVAFLAEYDALPEIGHACGHNLIAMASTAAAVGLAAVLEQVEGEVSLFGTPAEETNGAKVVLSQAGVFDGYDAAMIVHPGAKTSVYAASLALDPLEFTFHGRPAHAASTPHEGINALDAVIQLFNSLNALRQHLKPDVRIHGIISEGGVAPNIVPERAVARFYFRASERSYLNEVVQKAKAAAEGAALATGCSVEIKYFELSNDDLVTNRALADRYAKNLQMLGVVDITPPSENKGSTDMGNVSHVAPAIHPSMAIGPSTLVGHTHEFCLAAASPEALDAMLLAGKAMALTGLDILLDERLRQQVKDEFQQPRR
jgi:amidohydrolase